MVCAVEEIEKSTLFWGEGGNVTKMLKNSILLQCLNTFVAHCGSYFFTQGKISTLSCTKKRKQMLILATMRRFRTRLRTQVAAILK